MEGQVRQRYIAIYCNLQFVKQGRLWKCKLSWSCWLIFLNYKMYFLLFITKKEWPSKRMTVEKGTMRDWRPTGDSRYGKTPCPPRRLSKQFEIKCGPRLWVPKLYMSKLLRETLTWHESRFHLRRLMGSLHLPWWSNSKNIWTRFVSQLGTPKTIFPSSESFTFIYLVLYKLSFGTIIDSMRMSVQFELQKRGKNSFLTVALIVYSHSTT